MRPSNAVPADADLLPTRQSNDPRAEASPAAAPLPESQEGAGPVMTAAGVNWMRALRAARQQPGYALRAATSFAKGYYYRVKFRLLGRRVVIGRRFRVTGRLDIRGPGTVIFGD